MPIDTGISAKDRAAIAGGLSRLLADTYVLYLKTHGFHWNVEGPMFQTLHQMFMAQYTETWNAIDPIAERIRALGNYAPGSSQQYGKLAAINCAANTKRIFHTTSQLHYRPNMSLDEVPRCRVDCPH